MQIDDIDDDVQSMLGDLDQEGFMPVLEVARNIEEVNEIKKIVTAVQPTLLCESLFDLLCCFANLEQKEVSRNATTNLRDLYTQMAVNFKNVYDNILMKNDFVMSIMVYLPGYVPGERVSWPDSFQTFVDTCMAERPGPAFVRKYSRDGDNAERLKFLNFGRNVHDNYKACVAYSKKYFMPYWRNPKDDSGESVSGVLDAIRQRVMVQDARERAIAAVRV